MHPRYKNSNGSGFTLVELLVVISIIGTLAGAVLVYMGDMKQDAAIVKAKTFSASVQQSIGAELVGAWDFDEGSGTVAKDVSGNNRNGNLAGHAPVWKDESECVSGSCLEFDGVANVYVEIIDTPKLPLFTITAWVYNVSGGDARHSVLNSFWEVVGTQICYWSYDFDNGYWRCSASNVIPYGRWTFVATTWDGSVIRHYANGQMVWKDTSISGGTSQNFTTIAGYAGRVFKGKLDEIRIYAQEFTLGRIRSRYLSGIEKLFAGGQITENEYNERIRQLNKEYVAAEQKIK